MADPPDKALIDLLFMYTPVQDWLLMRWGGVVVDIYRVYKKPFANRAVFPSAMQVIEFGPLKARAVFVRTQIKIPDYDSGHRLFPTPAGHG